MTASSRGPNPEPPAAADRAPESAESAPPGPEDPPGSGEGPEAEAAPETGSVEETGPGAAEAAEASAAVESAVSAVSPESTESAEGGAPGDEADGADEPGEDGSDSAPEGESDPAEDASPAEEADGGGTGSGATDPAEAADTADAADTAESAESAESAGAADTAGTADAGELSEAAAEIAAQRELQARIERRKAEKDGPVESGAKLSGKAADLLAAVRAVESGQKPGKVFFDAPAPAPERPAPSAAAPSPEAVPRPRERRAEQGGGAPETVAAVRGVLAEGGAPESLAAGAAQALGAQAADALREDPWRLLSVPGVRPEQADGFARALLGDACGPGDERRAAALIVWRLEGAALRGHTALESSAVRAALAERSVPDPDGALERAIAEGAVLVFQDGAEDLAEGDPEHPESSGDPGRPDGGPEGVDGSGDGSAEAAVAESPAGPVLLGLDRYAMAEESLADGLARLARSGPDARWEAAEPTELVRAVAVSGLAVHTGGEAARAEPVALASAAEALGLRAVVAVHSERARPAVGPAAVTAAGLLSGAEGPGRDGDGALALDLLVVLDAPLLDVESAAMLVESLPDGARLVLSGDPGQLGAAGAGRVFGDLLAARVCPQIVSRIPDPGPLGELVSGIGAGELLQVAAPGKEIVIVPVRDAGEAVHRTVQLVADSVPRAIGVPAEQTQVITVGHGGAAGTRALNAALKQRLNPGPGRFGGFDPGDRVAYAQAPGRTRPGTVVSADAEGLRIDCEGAPVTVPKERVASALRHGWALTAHQAAGMRWPAAVVVLPGDAVPGLSRPWVYTAFGRGERHLSVVHGVDQALPRAVAEIPAPERTTRLRPLLEGLLAAPV
ncbi:helix-hairpin-helix domain-containing protein [Streptomyces sp. NPDC020141]|uniref:helix-hairpin-helix domain-containing protein n=1 Tax=Streptomyces sp. NPDC020141 TaxID=3365065 RepID=UPI0037B714AC